jgi:hypothetical protein
MKKYNPKFNHKSFQKRALTAIEFVETYVHQRPVPVSKTQIVKHFGQLQLASAQWLKDQLLICVDPYFNWQTHQCKKYIRNEQGLADLRKSLNMTPVKLSKDLEQQLDASEFVMTEKSDRFHNRIQYIPKKIRNPLLKDRAGHRFNYDIECAAPTLLYQYAKKLAAPHGRWIELPHIEFYLNDRKLVRDELSIKYNISASLIKEIIVGLFQGAQLSLSHNTRIFHLLSGNYNLIRSLKADPYLIELRNEIKQMWNEIIPEMKTQLNKKRINGKDKTAKYRELEREVMSVIKRELQRTNNRYLDIHDGWSCRDICDIRSLIDQVRANTGYVIKIDSEEWI